MLVDTENTRDGTCVNQCYGGYLDRTSEIVNGVINNKLPGPPTCTKIDTVNFNIGWANRLGPGYAPIVTSKGNIYRQFISKCGQEYQPCLDSSTSAATTGCFADNYDGGGNIDAAVNYMGRVYRANQLSCDPGLICYAEETTLAIVQMDFPSISESSAMNLMGEKSYFPARGMAYCMRKREMHEPCAPQPVYIGSVPDGWRDGWSNMCTSGFTCYRVGRRFFDGSDSIDSNNDPDGINRGHIVDRMTLEHPMYACCNTRDPRARGACRQHSGHGLVQRGSIWIRPEDCPIEDGYEVRGGRCRQPAHHECLPGTGPRRSQPNGCFPCNMSPMDSKCTRCDEDTSGNQFCNECLPGFRVSAIDARSCTAIAGYCDSDAVQPDTTATGKWFDDKTGSCVACDDPDCAVCAPPSAEGGHSTCEVCKHVKMGGYCRDTCDPGYYASSLPDDARGRSVQECLPCMDGCDVCSSATDCSRCSAGKVRIDPAEQGNYCVDACPSGMYVDNRICQTCYRGTSSTDCETCTPTGECLSCSAIGRNVLNDGVCVELPTVTPEMDATAVCPEGSFIFSEGDGDKVDISTNLIAGGVCESCDPELNCATCDNTPWGCTSCPDFMALEDDPRLYDVLVSFSTGSRPSGPVTDASGRVLNIAASHPSSRANLYQESRLRGGGMRCVSQCRDGRYPATFNANRLSVESQITNPSSPVCTDCQDANCQRCDSTFGFICSQCKAGYVKLYRNDVMPNEFATDEQKLAPTCITAQECMDMPNYQLEGYHPQDGDYIPGDECLRTPRTQTCPAGQALDLDGYCYDSEGWNCRDLVEGCDDLVNTVDGGCNGYLDVTTSSGESLRSSFNLASHRCRMTCGICSLPPPPPPPPTFNLPACRDRHDDPPNLWTRSYEPGRLLDAEWSARDARDWKSARCETLEAGRKCESAPHQMSRCKKTCRRGPSCESELGLSPQQNCQDQGVCFHWNAESTGLNFRGQQPYCNSRIGYQWYDAVCPNSCRHCDVDDPILPLVADDYCRTYMGPNNREVHACRNPNN
jgi:hypothetical protein